MAGVARLNRRQLLRSTGLVGALLLVPGGCAGLPRTGFERSGDRSWTSHDDELALLTALAERAPGVAVTEVGRSRGGRPVHLLRVGAAQAPAVLFVCGQHGNEPASREAGLELVRDLAFTSDPAVSDQLARQAVLVIPTANPDGRSAGARSNGVADLNRDHLALTQPETRAVHQVLRGWAPAVVVDLHEYRPPDPERFHHDVLYLWPRNLNADPRVRALSRTLGRGYVATGARSVGLTADEYGRVARAAAADVHPDMAGGGDEGLLRNAAALRHRLGLLVETAATLAERSGSSAGTGLRRRVQAQRRVMVDTLRFLRRHGEVAREAYAAAAARRAAAGAVRGAPVFFGGAEDEPPAPGEIVDPPPCRYLITASQARRLARVFALHGIRVEGFGAAAVAVPMGQPAASLIALLLDPRGRRHVAPGLPTDGCGGPLRDGGPSPGARPASAPAPG